MADYTLIQATYLKIWSPSPEEKLAKAKLAYKINRLMLPRQEMTQKEAANCLEIKEPRYENHAT